MSDIDPLDIIRTRIGSGSQVALAQEMGVSPTYLGDVIHGRKEPGKKILDALGLKRVVTYERIRKPRK